SMARSCSGRLQPAEERNCTRSVLFAQHLQPPGSSGLPMPVPRRSVALADARPRALDRALLQLVAAGGIAMVAVGSRRIFSLLGRSTLVRSVFCHDTRTSQETNPHWHT